MPDVAIDPDENLVSNVLKLHAGQQYITQGFNSMDLFSKLYAMFWKEHLVVSRRGD